MSFVRTLHGDITPGDMGVTYAHEHIVCRPPYWVEKGEDDLLLDDPAKSQAEVELFLKAGGRTIVDATAYDYGRDVPAVAEIARKAGIHVIGTAGLNKAFLWTARRPGHTETYGTWVERLSLEDLTRHIIREVEEGLEGTPHRAGQVKFGTGYNTIAPLEVKALRAAAGAHHATGAPVHSHTEAGTMALEQIELLREEGVDLRNVSFGHMDRNPDPYYHLKIAETGAYLCFDGIAKIKYAPESTRIHCILELARRGHADQILVSGDTARKSYYQTYGYGLGLGYILEKWVPRLIDEADRAGLDGRRLVKLIFEENPQRCFTFKKGA
ncbi:MAG TPA: phosphotriesterase [Symbiobacteriaceae bacterium]|nr:phosphotriesterase [Symbiobacteriaceae bacterium]